MNPSARERFILDRLEATGACTYASLAQEIGVGEMTIRRDVDRLAKQGKAFKVLGGVQNATAPKQFYESAWHQRISRNAAEKRAIAHEALNLVEPDRTVFLDGGTTSLALAKALVAENRPLNVVTNSTFVCLELAKGPHINVLSLGGKFDSSSGCLVGPTSEELARRFFVDVAFFSTLGVVPTEGTFESNIANLRIKQIIAEQAGKVVLLADHTKFGARALCKVLDIRKIHQIVTDGGTAETMIRELEQHGPQVTVVAQRVQAGEVATRAS
jgi:DeoR family L-fucose operon activator